MSKNEALPQLWSTEPQDFSQPIAEYKAMPIYKTSDQSAEARISQNPENCFKKLKGEQSFLIASCRVGSG